jgi:hypothetical protein
MNNQSHMDMLEDVFGFTVDDLNANRKGILSNQQMPHSKLRSIFAPGSVILVGMFCALGTLAAWSWYGTEMGLLMLILGSGATFGQFEQAKKASKNPLVINTLPDISKNDFLYDPFEEFSYKHTGEIPLYLTSKQFEVLDEDISYNIYYLGLIDQEFGGYDVLTIEPIPDH